jgi:hypothetical protein
MFAKLENTIKMQLQIIEILFTDFFIKEMRLRNTRKSLVEFQGTAEHSLITIAVGG